MMPDELTGRLQEALATASTASSDFDLNPDVALPEGRVLRTAAVLIAIGGDVDNPHVLLTKRSSRLKHHPGQIAFPGGKQDEDDATIADTALREAYEEVGLPRDAATILGELPCHETVTGFRVHPIVARQTQPFRPVPEAGEVDEVFRVPLAHVVDVSRFRIESRRWRGRQRHFYTVPYGPYYIWGATARILRGLADAMKR